MSNVDIIDSNGDEIIDQGLFIRSNLQLTNRYELTNTLRSISDLFLFVPKNILIQAVDGGETNLNKAEFKYQKRHIFL